MARNDGDGPDRDAPAAAEGPYPSPSELAKNDSNGDAASPLMPGADVLATIIGELGVLEDEAKTSSVKRGIASQREKLKELLSDNFKKRLRKAVTGDETKRVRDHIREPPVARSIDKWAFTFGVLILTMTEFVLVKHPGSFWVYYMTVIPLLVFFRIPHYRSLKWEFFMLDFCYYTQVLCMLMLYVFPGSCHFFKAIFILSNGPLACSVPAWRNSLVFHDVEKITSLYIHVFPAMLLYSIRWYEPPGPGGRPSMAQCGSLGGQDLALALLLYVAWQIMYLIKVEVAEKAKLDADPELLTSLRWLAQDKKNGLHQLVLFLTRKWGVLARDETFDHRQVKTKAIFVLTQFVYTLVTCLPSMLLIYDNHAAHIAYGLIIFVAGIYNGATYYIEVFSVRYVNKYPHERPAGLGAGRARVSKHHQHAGPVPAALEVKRSLSEGSSSKNNDGPLVAPAVDPLAVKKTE